MSFPNYSRLRNIEFEGSGYGSFVERVSEGYMSQSLDRKDIKCNYTHISFDDIGSELSRGKYETVIDDVGFRFFFNNGTVPKLFVFLNGQSNNMDNFSRWSWFPEGFTLAIADPMLTEHGLNLGWYYGTKNTDYRKLTAGLVSRIASHLGIPNENIVVYGSSGGGTASVFISEYLPGSTSVSINPQIHTKERPASRDKIQKKMNITFTDSDLSYRDDMLGLLQNHRSRHLFIVNILEKSDFCNLSRMMKSLEVPVVWGLSHRCDILCWTYRGCSVINNGGSWAYHNSLEHRDIFPAINHVLDCLDSPDITDFVLFTNNLWYNTSLQIHEKQVYSTLLDTDKDPSACLRAYSLYEKGDTVKKDQNMAFELLKKSVLMGNKKAIKLMNGRYLRLHPERSEDIAQFLSENGIPSE